MTIFPNHKKRFALLCVLLVSLFAFSQHTEVTIEDSQTRSGSVATGNGPITGNKDFTGTVGMANHDGMIEAASQCTTPGTLDQTCFTNSIALLNNTSITAIHFKSGTWVISSNVTITKQISIFCDGEQATIFQPTAAVSTVLTINNSGAGSGEHYSIFGCGFDMTNAPTATGVAYSNVSRPHIARVDIRYPNAITSTGTGFSLTQVGQVDFLQTFVRNAGICVLDNGDNGLEHHLTDLTCESPLIAGVKLTRTASADVGAVYTTQVRVTNPNARVGAVGYWFTSTAASTGTPFFLTQAVADSELGESVSVSADNATCASAGYCQTSASVGTFLTGTQNPIYTAGQRVYIAGVIGGTCAAFPNGPQVIASVPDSAHFTIAFTGTANQHCGAGTAAISGDGVVVENMAGGTISISDSWFANVTAAANKNCAIRLKGVNNFKLTNTFLQSAWGEICFEGSVTNIQVANTDFETGGAGSSSWVIDDRSGTTPTVSGWRQGVNNYNDTNFCSLASTSADCSPTLVAASATGLFNGVTIATDNSAQDFIIKNFKVGLANNTYRYRVNDVGDFEELGSGRSILWTNTQAGQKRGLDGSASVPTYGFSGGSQNTGMFRGSDDSLRLVTGGNIRLSLFSTDFRLGSGAALGMSSNADPTASGIDTALTRISAGLFGVGTGGAGSFAGGLKESQHIFGETTAPSAAASTAVLYADSTSHTLKSALNNGSFFNVTQTIGNGNVTTAGTAVTNGTCQAQTNITVTGTAVTDGVTANIGATLPATWQTGIVLSAHPTASNTVTVYLCNPTAASITPAATQVNVRVTR